MFQHWGEPSVSLTTDLWWSNLGILFSNPDVSFITHLYFVTDMKKQMGRWCSIPNTYSEFSLSCLSIGYNFQVIRPIVYFTSFPLLFLSPSSSHQKQNLLSKTLCSPQQVYMHAEVNNKLSYRYLIRVCFTVK